MNESRSLQWLAGMIIIAAALVAPANAQPYGPYTYTSQHRTETWGSVAPVDDILQGSYWMSYASAQAKAGSLRSASEAQESRGWMDVYAGSEAAWVDSLRVDSPGLAGQAGFAAFTIVYGWDFGHTDAPLDANATQTGWAHNAELRLLFGGGGASARNWSNSKRGQIILTGLEVAGGAIPGSYATGANFTALFPLTFGTPAHLDFRLRTESEVRDYYAFADTAHSAYWGGMKVFDAAMHPVAFSVDSQLGMDYSRNFAPVPEPASLVLTAIGLLTLLRIVSRKRVVNSVP